MFIGKILTGVWEEETIILKGMPKDFTLSARSLVVLELDEYERIKTALALTNSMILAGEKYNEESKALIEQALKG